MSAVRERVTQEDWSDGMARDVAPTLISAAGAFDIVNGLLDEDGNPYRRGGTTYKAKAGLGSSGLTWIWDGYLAPGGRTVFANANDFGVLAEDDETPVNLGGTGLQLPLQAAVSEDLLFIGGGSIYAGSRKSVAYSTGTATLTNGSKTVAGSGTAWKANVDAGMLFHIGNERVYAVASVDSDTQITLRDAYEGSTGGGKGYSLDPIYSVSEADPYESWDFVAECANRLVVASGRTIKFTPVKKPHTFTNSLGTTNEHTLPGGAWIVGLATVGQTVLVFTTVGAWILDGLALEITDINGNPQHRLQLLSGEVVLAGASGLAGSEQRVVVPAADGIYLMDGVGAPERISRPIDRLYRQRIVDGYPLGGAIVVRGHYFLPILDTNGDVRDLFVCRLDRPTHVRRQKGFPWCRFVGDGGEITCFALRSLVGSREPVLLGAQAREPSRVVDCRYFEPDELRSKDADGSTHDFDLVTRDMESGNGTENIVRGLELRYELVEGLSGGEPKLKVFWSDGSLAGGEAEWNEVVWDDFEWVASGALFHATSKDGPASDGRKPVKFRINKRLRYGRFRVSTTGSSPTSFALRSLEMYTRPSGALRR